MNDLMIVELKFTVFISFFFCPLDYPIINPNSVNEIWVNFCGLRWTKNIVVMKTKEITSVSSSISDNVIGINGSDLVKSPVPINRGIGYPWGLIYDSDQVGCIILVAGAAGSTLKPDLTLLSVVSPPNGTPAVLRTNLIPGANTIPIRYQINGNNVKIWAQNAFSGYVLYLDRYNNKHSTISLTDLPSGVITLT